jgi:hypothetical protein
MAQIIIDNAIVLRLLQIAEPAHQPLGVILQAMIESYQPMSVESNWPYKIAKSAELDTDIVWNERASDLSERSREILDNEFDKYIVKSVQKYPTR